MDRKVWLPSGGTLVIDRTEAMTVIDVNTGKFTGSGGNLEQTVTKNNLEAAEEIVRQLRLRDVGGIVVIDFIDMVLESNRDLVLRRLTEALARDRTRHQVSEVTSLGLVQLTRKRLGTGLIEAFSVPCECCNGRGVIITFDPEADTQASHHVHPRGGGNGGNGGNGSRGPGASPATVAARIRPDAPAAEASTADGQQAAVPHADAQPADAVQAAVAEAPDGPAEPPRSGTGRRRRRRPAASPAAHRRATASADPATASADPVAVSASPAPEAPAAPEATGSTSGVPPGTFASPGRRRLTFGCPSRRRFSPARWNIEPVITGSMGHRAGRDPRPKPVVTPPSRS